MTLSRNVCATAIAIGLLAAPALAQDTATALSTFYNQALAAEAKASATVDVSTRSFDTDDASAGCSGMHAARTTYGEARVAMEGMRDILQSASDLAPDYQKQGLDWVNANEPVVDQDMREIDRIIETRCETSSGASTASIDTLLETAATFMNRGLAANRDAREAFGNDDLETACNTLETARQNHSDGYTTLMQARSMVQGNHDLSPSVQREYFDGIDRIESESEGLATTMSELWRNRCSSR